MCSEATFKIVFEVSSRFFRAYLKSALYDRLLTVVTFNNSKRRAGRKRVEASLLHLAHQLLQSHRFAHVALQLQLAAHERHGRLQRSWIKHWVVSKCRRNVLLWRHNISMESQSCCLDVWCSGQFFLFFDIVKTPTQMVKSPNTGPSGLWHGSLGFCFKLNKTFQVSVSKIEESITNLITHKISYETIT